MRANEIQQITGIITELGIVSTELAYTLVNLEESLDRLHEILYQAGHYPEAEQIHESVSDVSKFINPLQDFVELIRLQFVEKE